MCVRPVLSSGLLSTALVRPRKRIERRDARCGMGENEKPRFRGAAGRGLGSLRRFLKNEERGGGEGKAGRKDGRRGSLRRVTITPRSLEVVKESNRRPRYFPDDEPTGKKKMPIRGDIRGTLAFLNRSRIATMNTRGSFSRQRTYRLTYGLPSCS